MKSLRFCFCVFLTLLMVSPVIGQDDGEESFEDDFTYDRRASKERDVVPYPHIREADVMYSRRIHRVIDSREKQNLPMKWPKNPFNCIIYNAAMEGIRGEKVTPYKTDSLTRYYDPEEVVDKISSEEVIEYRPEPVERPNYTIDSTVKETLQCKEIDKFRVMEDWIFDKQTSEFFPKIIAIAPMYQPEREGVELGLQEIFWVKYDQLRKILVNEPIFNRKNDAKRGTYYDFFEQRLFSSYIIKEPNEFDVEISEMPEYEDDPFAALLRSKEIERELFNWEHDLWEY